MASHVVEIARKEETEFRPVHLALEDDGAITMDAQDIGPAVTQFWGDDDYEFWVRVPATSVSKVAFEPLRQKCAGQSGVVDAFKDWCNTHGVEHEFDSWS